MSDETYAVHLVDGRVVECETITVPDDGESDWIRCIRSEPSPREKLPETTKYYNCENVARIERTDRNGSKRVIGGEQLDFASTIKRAVSK
ncbi:hypothetical protein [Natronococcus wangiae]|uniref:hypothetical protein n=1 Tax=Natronococcus wangiae TaxID=3068275 RepID=UPI00273FDB74|nr:hypothetical protein [Natronococcus sp. AD5]